MVQMARKKKKHEEHIDETWLIPYADMLTLLLALFIVLFAMSSLDTEKFRQMAIAFNKELKGGTGNKEFLNEAPPAKDVPLKEEKSVEELQAKQEMEELKQLQEKIDAYITANKLSLSLKTTLTERGLMITIMDNALFDSGKAFVKLESVATAKEISQLLVAASPREVMVSGHTDNVPITNAEFKSNWDLSTGRAVNFMQVLLENANLQPGKFSAIGYGEYRPVAPNDSAENRAKNRRVEVLILPLTKQP
ncbi:flagellar motor protein MotB [Ectobacillus sp. JY-23]|uniref:flagellar motor protein MotB n=1 Tax=Ectobacillus sp. JY-23 TaxID=2933872 RepID=UPI001FF3E3F9|nr:flagellar motor protein MotB [Ectobacillus sp. JY-23]UOY94224.1 flagellar motor protein MotB [Ectobacillus sp. JY-23]